VLSVRRGFLIFFKITYAISTAPFGGFTGVGSSKDIISYQVFKIWTKTEHRIRSLLVNVSEKKAKRAILATPNERGSANYAILYENEIVDNILESWITHA
jgi:hypothetical protein